MEKTPVASEVADVKPATPRKKAAPVRTAKAEKPPLAKKPATAAAAKKKPAPAAGKTKAENAPSPAKAKLAKAEKAEKAAKAKKVKLVRDSFTMPEPEYRTISLLKERCLKNGVAARKSEILRAAVASLSALRDVDLMAAVCRLEVIKTGRPAKGQK